MPPGKVPLPPSLGGSGAFSPTAVPNAPVKKVAAPKPKTAGQVKTQLTEPRQPKVSPTPKPPARTPRPGGSGQSGLPADYGNPAKLINPKDKAELIRLGKNPAIANVAGILGDPTGITSAVQSGVKFAQNPSVSTGLGAGLGAASLLPLGKGLRGVGIGTKLFGPEEKAAADLAAKEAAPKEGADIVRGALKGAKITRGKQEAGYVPQRGARATNVAAIYADTTKSVAERKAAAKAAMKGPLEKQPFQGFKDLTPAAVNDLQGEIMAHPTLSSWRKTRLIDSLDKGVAGQVPTRSELRDLEQFFGKDRIAGLSNAIKAGRFKQFAENVVNTPRTLQATLDMSAFLRQGAVALAKHPVITGRNFKTLVKSYASEDAALASDREIAMRPTYNQMEAGGVALTGVHHDAHEEQYAAHLLEALGGTKNPIHWSSRSYSAFLNKVRADVFDHLLSVAHDNGYDVHNEQFLKELGSAVNAFTGRGDLPASLEKHASFFNGLFFSPRLMASRLQVMGQPFNLALARRNPFVYKQYVAAAAKTYASLASILYLAHLAGARVGLDPRSADFGKIRLGNTRVDLGAGFLQYAHLAGELAKGQTKSSTTGKVTNLSGAFGQRSYYDLLQSFLQSKASPPLAMFLDATKQKTGIGPYNLRQELQQHLLPLSGQDIYSVAQNRSKGPLGVGEVLGGGALSVLGGGLQTYGPQPSKKPPGSPFGGSSSGASSPFNP